MNSIRLFSLALVACVSAQAAEPGAMSVTAIENELTVESKGGPVSYKVVIDRKKGGDIKQLSLPNDSKPVANDLNSFFFHGAHGDEYTLRGWTGRERCILSSSANVISQRSEEIVVQVSVDAAGTYKVVASDPGEKAKLAGKIKSYQEKTVEIKRRYAFRPDHIEVTDEVRWIYPGMEFNVIEWTASFVPGSVQSPARLVKGPVQTSFYPVGSGGDKLPSGITYPFTVENFLKSGWKVSLVTTDSSFDLGKSKVFLYEKPWQTDWDQGSGFRYELPVESVAKAVRLKTKVSFAKALKEEMPPVVTLKSPGPGARWMDEKGEVANYRIGDTVNLATAAVNADGSPVGDKDLTWEISINAWWKRKPFVMQGAKGSYRLPEAANDEEKSEAQKRTLLAVIKLTAKGNNGTEATEHFATLVGE